MKKTTIFIIILCVSVALGAVDFMSNNYSNGENLKANVKEIPEKENFYLKEIQEINPAIELKEQEETHSIFNKIDTDKTDFIQKTEELLFTLNNVNYFKIYTFKFSSEGNQINYLKLKNIFEEISKTSSNLAINEVNNYGINSFYVNDTKDEEMARLIILTEESLFAIEYSKALNKESIEPLLSNLTGNVQ